MRAFVLPISTGDDVGIGTLGVALVEYVDRSLNILRGCILGGEVLGQACGVFTTNTLAARFTSKFGRKTGTDLGSHHGALCGSSATTMVEQ